MVTVGINVFEENSLDTVLDTVIDHGTVQDIKAFIMYFMEEDPRTTVKDLATLHFGIHPSNFSPSACGRWRMAFLELLDEKKLKQIKRGTKSLLILGNC